jgi:hypothetical protein
LNVLTKVTKVAEPKCKTRLCIKRAFFSLANYLLYCFTKQPVMSLGDELLKKINKTFEPSAKLSLRYKGYDLVLITDKDGNAVQLFMGKAAADGSIKGDRYARTLKHDREGRLIKDHWERKGKST